MFKINYSQGISRYNDEVAVDFMLVDTPKGEIYSEVEIPHGIESPETLFYSKLKSIFLEEVSSYGYSEKDFSFPYDDTQKLLTTQEAENLIDFASKLEADIEDWASDKKLISWDITGDTLEVEGIDCSIVYALSDLFPDKADYIKYIISMM